MKPLLPVKLTTENQKSIYAGKQWTLPGRYGFVDAVPPRHSPRTNLANSLALSDETQAVLVAKGGFFQQTGGNWIFKVSEDGTKAYKVDVQLGRQNPDYYEVLSGLQPGDKVVTSSYENYGNMQELVLKK